MRLAYICRCGTFNKVREHAEKCGNCGRAPYFGVEKQTIQVDGPTLSYIYDENFPIDHNDPQKRRIIPSKRAYKEHIARSEGSLEAIG